MAKKLIYVTKKQVNKFIEGETVWRGITNERLLEMVKSTITELLEYDGEVNNPNQLKYYRRIQNRLVVLK